jgi:5'(3')-deoxyribonucleotidase
MDKPTLLLDVDGVLADFISAALSILRNKFGVVDYHHDTIETWEMFSSMPAHAHLKDEVYEILKKEGGCFSMLPYDGAVAAVQTLKRLVDIVIVTSPFYGSKTWVHEREKWLEYFFNISHKDMIHTGRKELVHGDILVDDKLETIEKWSKRWPHGHAIIWDQRYNQSNEVCGQRIYRVGKWPDLVSLIQHLVELREVPPAFRTGLR